MSMDDLPEHMELTPPSHKLEASIITTDANGEIRLGVTADRSIPVSSMKEIAQYSDALAALVASWRADQQLGRLTGMEKLLAEVITERMREEVAKHNEAAAETFPDDVLFGGMWTVRIEEVDGAPNSLRSCFEVPVKHLISQVAVCFAAAETKRAELSAGNPQS